MTKANLEDILIKESGVSCAKAFNEIRRDGCFVHEGNDGRCTVDTARTSLYFDADCQIIKRDLDAYAKQNKDIEEFHKWIEEYKGNLQQSLEDSYNQINDGIVSGFILVINKMTKLGLLKEEEK